jgi:type II secretory pathway pseudopilin PulG
MIVVVIVGILTTVALPKVGSAVRSNAVHAASRKTVALLSQARAQAIQHGRNARFIVRSNGSLEVKVLDTDLTNWIPISAHSLGEEKITLTSMEAADTIVEYDPRGLAVAGATKRRYVIKRDGVSDTVCVFGRGKVAINKCLLAQ